MSTAEVCNIGLEPLMRPEIPALTRPDSPGFRRIMSVQRPSLEAMHAPWRLRVKSPWS
jgi:hypothetical protein